MPSLRSFASWRTLALILALLNLKCLPLSWHIRLSYHMFRNWWPRARIQRTLESARPRSNRHPIFEPVSIYSRCPLLEMDYNLHKSNSTYFSDLDISRTALATRLIVAALKPGHIELEKQGYKGPMNVILGSVHTSFHREIKPYELYEIRSRLLGWDKKWMIIGSWFVRPGKNGKKETLLASALSKYVVKKGKFTVNPERCFTTAGWVPARPEERKATSSLLQIPGDEGYGSSEERSNVSTPQEGLISAPPTSLGTVAEKLEKQPDASVVDNWDWEGIDKERLRGLQIAKSWLALDKELMEEFVNV